MKTNQKTQRMTHKKQVIHSHSVESVQREKIVLTNEREQNNLSKIN